MTEYWVSQAKHWCEYCRIYIGGSKQSIAFHENGKKHKEIVELSLKDMRQRARAALQSAADAAGQQEGLSGNHARVPRSHCKCIACCSAACTSNLFS